MASPITPPWKQSGTPAAGASALDAPAAGPAPTVDIEARAKPAHDAVTGRFVKGGGGRPKGSKNKCTVAIENMLEGEAEAITRRVIDAAKGGDPTAMKIVMDRIAPVRKGRPLQGLARREGENSVEALLRAVLEGELTPDEGQSVVSMVESAARIAAQRALSEMREQALENLKCASAKVLHSGVMLVPLPASLDQWEEVATEQQSELKRKERE